MADERCVFVYKCRLCGKVFKDCFTGRALATKFIIQSACDLKKDEQCPGNKTAHFAEDHIGIADLIGCKIEENEIAKEHGYCDTCKHNGGYPTYETCQGCLNFDKYERGDTE